MLNQGTDGPSTAASESTLADDLASLMGEDWASESPGQDESEATGAPPAAESSAASDGAQDGSEGDETAPVGAPPVEAATTPAPDQGTSDDSDPLAGAEPLTYTVNGQQRTFDGLTKLGDKGAIVSAEALPKLQQRLSERDNLFERSQEQYQKYAALEDTLTKLTQWSLGKDGNGQERILTGVDAVEAQRTVLGRSLATLNVLARALDDPQQFARLVQIVDDGQGGLAIIPDPNAIANLKTLAENAAIKAEQSVARHFATVRASLTAVPAPAPREPAPQTTAIEPAQAAEAVKGFVKQLNVTGLTAEDETFLAESLPRYVRPATPEERAQWNSPVVVDIAFGKLIERTASMRATVATTVSAASKAAEENTRKLAAAAVGVRGKSTAQATRVSPPAKKAKQSDSDRAWELQERLQSGKLSG